MGSIVEIIPYAVTGLSLSYFEIINNKKYKKI